jgi:ketosteroid isomerase-like protein
MDPAPPERERTPAAAGKSTSPGLPRSKRLADTRFVVSQERVEAVRRTVDAFNRRDVSALLAAMDPEVEWIEDLRYPGAEVFRGHAGVEQSIRKWWDAWDITMDVGEIIDLGDHVVAAGHTYARGEASDVVLTAEYGGVFQFNEERVVRVQACANREAALEAAGQPR